MLTENVAILSFIADRYPALTAPGDLGRYRLLEMLAYIAAETAPRGLEGVRTAFPSLPSY